MITDEPRSIKLRLAAENRRLAKMLGALERPSLLTPALDPEGARLKGNLCKRSAELNAIREAMAQNPAQALFDEVLAFLRRPLFTVGGMDCRQSERWGVEMLNEEPENEPPDPWERPIAYEAWGEPWIEDRNGFSTSFEGIGHLQKLVFWESLEEMGLINNELEKWSVLKWVFTPAIRKLYIFDRRINRSHCLPWHERDHPFSFHNCCIAARVDEEDIRNGFRRNVPAEIIQAVERVCAY